MEADLTDDHLDHIEDARDIASAAANLTSQGIAITQPDMLDELAEHLNSVLEDLAPERVA